MSPTLNYAAALVLLALAACAAMAPTTAQLDACTVTVDTALKAKTISVATAQADYAKLKAGILPSPCP